MTADAQFSELGPRAAALVQQRIHQCILATVVAHFIQGPARLAHRAWIAGIDNLGDARQELGWQTQKYHSG
ncbi:hypothetical protein D9M68_898960 [compost metagenome]